MILRWRVLQVLYGIMQEVRSVCLYEEDKSEAAEITYQARGTRQQCVTHTLSRRVHLHSYLVLLFHGFKSALPFF